MRSIPIGRQLGQTHNARVLREEHIGLQGLFLETRLAKERVSKNPTIQHARRRMGSRKGRCGKDANRCYRHCYGWKSSPGLMVGGIFMFWHCWWNPGKPNV